VYLAFDDIRTRYPQISRALFFVDKDIDDIIGKPWPSDPRIFTTDVYSIENYAAVKECIEGYIRNYMKFKGVEIEISTIISKFVEEQSRFHRLILPIMAWIVLTRRMGFSVNLNDINLAELFEVKECTICRIPKRKTLSYLMKVTQTKKECSWRALRQTAAELKRLSPKLYIRGKFEAWWFVVFVASAYQSLLKVAKESRGSVSVTLPITNGNFIPVLAEMTPPVPRLSTFAEFHFRDMVPSNPEPAVRSVRRLWWHHH
jgi:hypothetical protein